MEPMVSSIRQGQVLVEGKPSYESLLQNAYQFKTLVANLPVAVYRCPPETACEKEFINEGIVDISGYTARFFSGETGGSYTAILHPEDRELYRRAIRAGVSPRNAYDIEYRIIRADGQVRWVNERGRPVVEQRGRIRWYIGAIFDITDNKKAVAQSRLDESRLRAVLELNQMTDASLNEITGFALEEAVRLTHSKVGYLAFANEDETVLRMYSWSMRAMKECRMRHKPFTYHIDRMGLWGEAVRQRRAVITNDYAAPNPYKKGYPEGHVQILRHLNLPLIDQGRIVLVAGVGNKEKRYDEGDVRQLTLLMQGMWRLVQRKRIEEELRESEAKYRSVFENSGAPSVIIEEDMTISMANTRFEELTGFTKAEIEGKRKFFDFIAPEDVPRMKEYHVGRRKTTEDVPAEYECRLKDRKAEAKDIAVKIGMLPDMKRSIASFIDITESKKAEAILRESEAHLRRENLLLKSPIQKRYGIGDIVGKSEEMQKVYNAIVEAAGSGANIIIYGESGTGKELVARAIHDLSPRKGGRFVSVNCGAVPEQILESEFFGYKKGAFTGADADKRGYLDAADGGTLFLDEIGEISPSMQVKLLRAIEGKGYSPVGSLNVKTPDFRIIAATNQNLSESVRKGLVRQDFFYRVHVIPIYLPALRERKEDIPLLINHFLEDNEYAGEKTIPPHAIQALMAYNWPGNVRELQNVLHRFLTFKKLDFLDMAPAARTEGGREEPDAPESGDLQTLMAAYEKRVIRNALAEARWRRNRCSEILGINRKTLFKKMKKYDLE